MNNYRVKYYLGNSTGTVIIKAHSIYVYQGSYIFLRDDINETTSVIAYYPVSHTIIEVINDNNE